MSRDNTATAPVPAVLQRHLDLGHRLVALHWIRKDTGACSCSNAMRCKNPGKHPIESDWPKKASNNALAVGTWLRRWPQANWGWMMGPEYIALDVDTSHGEDGLESLGELEKGRPLPRTCMTTTASGGHHLVLRNPGDKQLATMIGWRPGLDVLTERAQIVIEPSVTEKGAYAFNSFGEPPDCPAWLLELLPEPDANDGVEPEFTFNIGAAPPKRAAALLEEPKEGRIDRGAVFRATYNHTREKKGDTSQSGWDHSVALAFLRIHRDATDQELADLISAHRGRENWAGHRPVYYITKTIGSVRKVASEDKDETASEPTLDTFMATDLGNSERLVAWFGDGLRHVPAWGWLVWTGGHWSRNDKLARELAHRTVRQIYKSSAEHPDADARKRLAAWAVQSESSSRITAMLKEAESHSKVRAEVADFDRDPMALNVRNGTVDLRTGELRAHRSADLFAKMIPLDFEPGATSEVWDRFLVDCTKGKAGLAEFLRRAAGYTLTGLTREDALFLPHGPGGTGKTTFVGTLQQAMGPYAGSVRIEVLTTGGRSSGGHNEDIARLVGLRLVTAVEASDNERLREGQVKHMTGGDAIPASLKHRPGFDFQPVLKLWISTNEVPFIRPEDTGMWRRVHKMPFENQHGKTALKDELAKPEHLTAVMAWAVRGCLEWQRDGLKVPECVTVATTDLRRRMDGGFEQFLAEHCELGREHEWAMARDIRASYTRWAAKMGVPEVRRLADQRIAAILRQRGCEDERRRWLGPDDDPVKGWWGISVQSCELARAACAACASTSHFSSTHAPREKKSQHGAHSAHAAQEVIPGMAGSNGSGCPHSLTVTVNGTTTCRACGASWEAVPV